MFVKINKLLSTLQSYDQKNIRRRVYDALNVLMAMNIISKEKKEIKWIGLPANSAQECQNLDVGGAYFLVDGRSFILLRCSIFWHHCIPETL